MNDSLNFKDDLLNVQTLFKGFRKGLVRVWEGSLKELEMVKELFAKGLGRVRKNLDVKKGQGIICPIFVIC